MDKTQFEGRLYFDTPNGELTASQLAELKKILEENSRHNSNWVREEDYSGYFDFCLTSDFSGIEWNGMETSSFMTEQVNCITKFMRNHIPDFRFRGQLLALSLIHI